MSLRPKPEGRLRWILLSRLSHGFPHGRQSLPLLPVVGECFLKDGAGRLSDKPVGETDLLRLTST